MNNNEQIIKILPEVIANQIAAGEVVQRPESVIKELVENSIDAGATMIAVVVRKAGKSLIHVVDNGKGMSKNDIGLALKRHATSKITTVDDLHKISTLGFRGEALASISSVANIEIRTATSTSEHGWKLISEPLRQDILEPVQQEQGTQIFVRNLFYNIPARKKFLRSDITEFRHISDSMIRFALSHPHIRFVFHDGDSLIFDVPISTLHERICILFGNDIGQSCIPIEYERQSIIIDGFLGKPNIARSTKASQYFFLNQRTITNKSLAHAVYSGFEHLIDKSQHPLFILNITIDPSEIDVNIHPQKHEVKFGDERTMYSIVQEAVLQSLRSHNLVPELRFRLDQAQTPFEKIRLDSPSAGQSDAVLVNTLTGEIIEQQRPTFDSAIKHSNHYSSNQSQQRSISGTSQSINNTPHHNSTDWTQHHNTAYEALFGKHVSQNLDQNSSDVQNSLPHGEAQNILVKSVWQMHNKYIFVQTTNGVMIIDQHIAHERILYEKALRAMNDSYPYSQALLFPIDIMCTPSELILIRELQDDLIKLGFMIDTIEESICRLSGVPLDVRSGDEANVLREIIEQYAEYNIIRPSTSRDTIAASYGCRTAIKAGDPLTTPEMSQLINDLYACQTPDVCPHGRPVMINFELRELDNRFGRTS